GCWTMHPRILPARRWTSDLGCSSPPGKRHRSLWTARRLANGMRHPGTLGWRGSKMSLKSLASLLLENGKSVFGSKSCRELRAAHSSIARTAIAEREWLRSLGHDP